MKLGVIGCGKMGSALLGGILKAKLCAPSDITVFDAYEPAVEGTVKKFGVKAAASNSEVVEASEVILLCVKPQTFDGMLSEISGTSDRLLISIAAGVKIDTIAGKTNNKHRIIRVMPNTPSLVGRGASAIAPGALATPEDISLADKLLSSVGYACQVEESNIDAVTALSGSGPAYIFLMIESMVAAGIAQGLPAEIAHNLAVETVAGAAELVKQTGESPSQLRENVTSPNGTTFAALESFRESDYSAIVSKALDAARDRSIELGDS